jgi:RNA polymerase sigma-70 factor (ECF subfamily)
MTLTDAELLAQIGLQDEEGFAQLQSRYQELLRRYLARMVHDLDAADDLMQEVWLRVWTRAEQWDGRGPCRAWLFRIAANLALNHLRGCRRRRELSLPLVTGEEEDGSAAPSWLADSVAQGPEALLEQSDRLARLQQYIAALPEEKREVFRMVYTEERELREVAALLGIPEGTVKSRLYHARQRLARLWREDERVMR